MSRDLHKRFRRVQEGLDTTEDKKERKKLKAELLALEAERATSTHELTAGLEKRTRLESRVTILGHLQRGGVPSAADRLLATRIGTAATQLISEGKYGVMVAARGDSTEAIPLEQVVGKRKIIPLDHPWVNAARDLGVCLGDV